jgi:nucleoside-diphosphate-sugar epimerase
VNWLQKTIFVTGATGFIGGRVCERLIQAGATDVRALVHTTKHAARIARLPVKLCAGNLLDPGSVRKAMGPAKIVIHCGLGRARAIVHGTYNLLQIAEANGVERFVHMSTAAVYGITPKPGSEVEDAPVPTTGDPYCDNKARAERVVHRFVRKGLPAVILRPSIVYGPYSAWSTRLIHDLRGGHVVLIDGGRGACNTIYVDNLVDAVFLSIENDRAPGETFFITDGEPVTWGDFIQAHVAMMNHGSPLPEMSKDEIAAQYSKQGGLVTGSLKATNRVLRSRELRQLLVQIPATQRVLSGLWRWLESMPPEKRERIRSRFRGNGGSSSSTNGRYIPDEVTLATQTTTVFFRIDKARQILGYTPRIPFAHGIDLVEQWLRFANHL